MTLRGGESQAIGSQKPFLLLAEDLDGVFTSDVTQSAPYRRARHCPSAKHYVSNVIDCMGRTIYWSA